MSRPDWKTWINNRKECLRWHNIYLKKGMLRSTPLKPNDYMRKAVHNLDFANWVNDKHKNEIKEKFHEQRFFDWVIIIYYYAIYHASLSLIATKGLSSKSHAATLNALILYFYH